jgi:hypothetical protein
MIYRLALVTTLLLPHVVWAGDPSRASAVDEAYVPQIRPLLKSYCYECHSGDRVEAEVDLASFENIGQIRQHPRVWQQVAEMLDSAQMPPVDATQPSTEQRKQLRDWVHEFLKQEASAHAGDPGPVVLRRLNNAEYTYTLRDLTGISTLDPAREFPVDGAAGEGFTNTGQALVMSPALVTKYLDAAKQVARHMVLLPDGIRFSASTTRSDWTNETLAQIRDFYRQFADAGGGETVNLQGIIFSTNEGGRLPVELYLAATLEEREALRNGRESIEQVAQRRKLNGKYLQTLWNLLDRDSSSEPAQASLLLDAFRTRWQAAGPSDSAALASEIGQWQKALWRFSSVGHIGKLNGPQRWMEPVEPLTTRQEFRVPLPASAPGTDVVLYLAAGDAGDGNEQDYVVWERPRLVAPGRPDLLLRDLRVVCHELAQRRSALIDESARCLAAADEALRAQAPVEVAALSTKHSLNAESLAAWFDFLGIASQTPAQLGTLLSRKQESTAGYEFVRGWVGDDALSVVANSSDQHVRIPGNLNAHSVAVHPAPTQSVGVGWRSPEAMTLEISGSVQHAHPECGNGVAWVVELRRGNVRQRLAEGISHGAAVVAIPPQQNVAVQSGDVIALVISPRDGNHSCDLTLIDLVLRGKGHEWSIAKDLSSDILAGNPHADAAGNADVWHCFTEPIGAGAQQSIPAGSLLARWQTSSDPQERATLAQELQAWLQRDPASLPADAPDTALYHQLMSVGGPLLSAALRTIANTPVGDAPVDAAYGLDPARFAHHPSADHAVESASLCVQAPALIEIRLPADLVAGAEFVTSGALHVPSGREGSVQLRVQAGDPPVVSGLQASSVTETNAGGPWTSNNRGIAHATPVVVTDEGSARIRFQAAFDDFRNYFPAALCYPKIVPVDEVVTLTLHYREDDHLQRLMLSDAEVAHLNRLWDELHFISHDALQLVDAYAQLMEFATQDADPKVFEPLRQPIQDRAAAFRQQLIESEPAQFQAVARFAAQAFRRQLTAAESSELTRLYAELRQREFPHDESLRLLAARILTSPAFLYRLEQPVDGAGQGPIQDSELATRLSYFLWSTAPDAELRQLAQAGELNRPKVLVAQTERLLSDDRVRRLAIEFACQWLHIRDFDQLDEKSERHFPEFTALRGPMYEEAIQFLTDLFQHNGSILSLLEANHTFLNQPLAEHYGIPGVSGPEWRRVDDVAQYGRGGMLSWGSILAKQAGASRTSPILRGAWLSEVILGEKLPRPPKDVPVLSDEVPAGLTERQMTERHSNDAACAKCHVRIDPLGFALEAYDAIGRYRAKDANGPAIDTRVTLPDGTPVAGLTELQQYLATTRREAFVRQFTRKLLGYALGRSVQLSDEPLLADLQASLAKNDYRVWTAMDAIVQSRQFREIRGREFASADEPSSF